MAFGIDNVKTCKSTSLTKIKAEIQKCHLLMKIYCSKIATFQFCKPRTLRIGLRSCQF